MTEHDDTPRDPTISRRYGETAEQAGMAPPPALDASILAAARAAVQPPAAAARVLPRPWWQRLTLPIGVVATTLLAVMLSLTVQRQTPETVEHDRMLPKAPAPSAGAPPRSAADAAPPRQPAPATGRAETAPPAPAQAERIEGSPRSSEKKAMRQATESVAPAAPAAFPAPAASDAPAPPAAAPAAPSAIAPAPAVANEAATVTSRLKAESTADRAREADASAPMQKAAPAAAAPARLGVSRGDVAPTASAWIEEIRELKRQGRVDEAARRLAAFRRAYPEYVLPDDLKN